MKRVLKPPTCLQINPDIFSVFLAGSIEMGKAENWQAQVEKSLADLDIVVLNPRRDEWDASWVQSIDNPLFFGQVKWELDGLEKANLVAMYLAPSTQAPVSLLELGLTALSGKLLVCCPDGFWRKGNVEVVCRRFNIPLFQTLEELITEVRYRFMAFTPPGTRSP